MITLEDYFGPRFNHPEATEDMKGNARVLLARVNALLAAAQAAGGYARPINPKTQTAVSGWSGDGGFRLTLSATGAPKSAHKRACAVDVYDPGNVLDNWLTDAVLTQFNLYREHPDDTPGWCHLQITAPGSGRRTFKP